MSNAENQGLRFQFLAGATDLFCIAKRTANLIESDVSLSNKDLRDSNLVAIVFSALAVEAFLNELTTLDGWTSPEIPSLVALDERLRALQRVLKLAEEGNLQAPGKLKLAHEILGQQLEIGGQLFQDYRLLKQLRDSIVHAKPTSVQMTMDPVQYRSTREKLLRSLQSRGLLSFDPSQKGQGFLDWLDSRRLAEWATQAASGVVLQTIEALPVGQFKVAAAMLYREFSLRK